MAYQIDQRTGLPIFGGLPVPLTPDQLAAAGVAPPMPAPNPYGGLPPDAVAGSGGGPTDLGNSPDAQIRMIAGDGRGQQLTSADLIKLAAPVNRAHAPEPSHADAMLNAGVPAGQGAQPLKLIPTVGEAQAATASPDLTADKEQQARIFDSTLHPRGGGGTAPSLGVTGETVKSTQYGTVPEALAQDITDKQAAVDKATAASYAMQAQGNAADLGRQAEVIAQQQKDAAAAQARQELVNQRIAKLQSASDADEAALQQAKPKEVGEFWGGSAAAQILSAISVALGAGVQTRTGHNPAQEILDKSIDRWVNDQKQQYDVARDKASISNNRYKDALAQFGTPEAATANLQLQALTAKSAMVQNMAEQSKNQQWLASAQNMQAADQLKRQELRAQQIQQAGMHEVEQKLSLRGGTGSAADRELLALRHQAEAKKLQDEIGGRTNEDIKTGVEVEKAKQTTGGVASAANAAADAAERFRAKVNSLSGRAPGEGKGEAEAARMDAEGKYAAYLVKSGQASTRNALTVAQEFFKGKGDVVRGPSADPALTAHIKTLRGNAVRADAQHAAGLSGSPDSSDEGSLE